MEKAIQKAIEGGWNWRKDIFDFNRDVDDWEEGMDVCIRLYPFHDSILLSPLFWQALGKAMGWTSFYEYRSVHSTNENPDTGPMGAEIRGPRWLKEWIGLTLHLAEGKDAESFFNELLK